VRVIAPGVEEEIARRAAAGEIEWLPRRYAPGDLAGAAVVFAATGDDAAHAAIWAEGLANNQLVNVMDVVDKCNFHGVSFLRRGLLTIAVGTGGAAPALAVTLRKRFEQEIGPEYAAFLEFCRALRPEVSRRIRSFRKRREFWYALVESEALALLRAGRAADVGALTGALLDRYGGEGSDQRSVTSDQSAVGAPHPEENHRAASHFA
jgi:siroheme synthase-like protein